jgi:hypothetical protein
MPTNLRTSAHPMPTVQSANETFFITAKLPKEGALLGLSLDDQLLFNTNNAIMNALLLDVRIQLAG